MTDSGASGAERPVAKGVPLVSVLPRTGVVTTGFPETGLLRKELPGKALLQRELLVTQQEIRRK